MPPSFNEWDNSLVGGQLSPFSGLSGRWIKYQGLKQNVVSPSVWFGFNQLYKYVCIDITLPCSRKWLSKKSNTSIKFFFSYSSNHVHI
jgi:hypothetical protein